MHYSRAVLILASALYLASGVRAEDITLNDGRAFTGASVSAPLVDGSVIVSGKDETGIDYFARVQPDLLPREVLVRMRVEAKSGDPQPASNREPIEVGKPEIKEVSSDANEVIYSWRIQITNTTSNTRRLKLTFGLFDEFNFQMAEGNTKDETVGPFRTETFTGTASVKAALARKSSIKRVQVAW